MLAHCAASAKDLRADLADGEVLLAKPDTCSTPGRLRFSWKWAYRVRLSSMSLKSSLRGLLQWILEHSDEFGRLWWGQTALAKKMKCTTKTLRRYFAELEETGHLRVEKHSFKSLTAAQEALGLPLPGRNDAGRAPNVLTLLVDGEDASSYAYPMSRAANVFAGAQRKSRHDKPRPGIAGVVPLRDFVPGEPGTKTPEIPPDKRTDDPLDSAFLTRKVEGDPEVQPHPILVDDLQTVGGQSNLQSEPDAWRALNGTYDAQYRRVYRSTPTNKCMAAETKQALIVHIEEMTAVFETQLLERGVDVLALPEKPMKMLVDEALRAWFDSSGSNNFLRRLSHPMRLLVSDLPHRVRKAIETLIEKLVPKPRPRKPLALVLEVTDVRRMVVQDKLAPMKLPMLPIHEMHAPLPRASVSPGIQLIFNGLSAHSTLREFGGDAAFAQELEALARERGLGSAHVFGALEKLAHVAQRMQGATSQARKNAVFAAAIEWFGETNARLERSES